MTTTLLRTKLYAPPPRPNLVARPRLIEHIDQGLRVGHRLTLVSAPAGYGKTTLLSAWWAANRDQERKLAWLSLDERDNDPARFWAYVIGALQTLRPDLGQEALSQLQAPQPPPVEGLLTQLLNQIAEAFPRSPSSPQLILLLDDYHVIETPAIDEALAFLIDHLPPQLHLVIATRADPGLPLPRLRARGQLTEIRAADLRFTAGEAAAFLNQTMGLDLAAADVATLETRTEGWIAGLQLVALSMRSSEDPSGFIADLTGSDRFILDYLAAEVLRQQPASRQAFLLRTSILDRLCGPLCDAVLASDEARSSQQVLEALEADNLFIVALDNERRWYRYHRLFADFLRSRLHQVHPDQVLELHRRAAAWYEDNELLVEAIEHALQGRDLDRAARLIEGTTHALLMRGEVTTLLHWLEQLPSDVIHSRPRLSVSAAEALTVAGQLDPVETYLDWAEESLRMDTAPPDAVQGQIYALRAYIAFFEGDVLHAARLARQAYALLPEDDAFLRSVASWFLGLTQLFGRDMAAADEALTESMDLGTAAGSPLTTLLSIFVQGHLEILRGHLHQAEALFREGQRQVEPEGAPPDVVLSSASPALSLVYQGMGNLHREWNDLETAEGYLRRSIELAQRWGNGEVLVDTYILLARVKRAQGEPDGAEEALRQAEQMVDAGQVATLTGRLVQAFRAQFWVMEGELETAADWAAAWKRSAALPDDAQSALFLRWIEESALVRLLLAQGKFDTALEILACLIRRAEAGEWDGILIELLALQALALQGQGATEAALPVLNRALALGEPEGYVRTFVDLGAGMARLLRRTTSRGVGGDYASQLLAIIEAEQTQIPTLPTSPTPAKGLIEPLTDREGEVLRLIAAGLTNQQIADELFIAHSTVKTHINNLYGKLDVSRRTQAVARARELGLL
jgi:LuxR family maltose regulon positive regulatory protein